MEIMMYWLRICNKNIRLYRHHKHLSSFNFNMIKTSNHLLNTVSDTVLGALKFNMKWIMDWNLKPKTIKLVEEKIKRKSLWPWSKQKFLRACKALIIKERKW